MLWDTRPRLVARVAVPRLSRLHDVAAVLRQSTKGQQNWGPVIMPNGSIVLVLHAFGTTFALKSRLQPGK